MAGKRNIANENLELARAAKGKKTGRRPTVMQVILRDLDNVKSQAELGMDMDTILKIREIPRKNWDQIKQNENFIIAFDTGKAKLQQWNLQKAKEMIELGKADVMSKYLSNFNDFSEKPVNLPSKIVVKLPEGMGKRRNSGKGQKGKLKLVENASN